MGRYLADLRHSGALKPKGRLRYDPRTDRFHVKRYRRGPKLRRHGYAPGRPGDLVQFDTVVSFIEGLKRYTITAIDLPSRFSFAWSYPSLSSKTSTDFLTKLRLASPFPILRVQTDNGQEFHGRFRENLGQTGTIQFFNHPRSPKQNAFIERFNRTLREEFLSRNNDSLAYDLPHHNRQLMEYLIYYNAERPHSGLHKKTPLECLHLTPQSQVGWTTTGSCNSRKTIQLIGGALAQGFRALRTSCRGSKGRGTLVSMCPFTQQQRVIAPNSQHSRVAPTLSPDFVLPQPSPEGIAQFRRHYQVTYGKAISEGEAREALGALITIVYHCTLIENAC